MKFILNTSVDPHFCALFDAENNLIESHSWIEHRRDGEEVFDFLSRHEIYRQNITFCGGVSGPGGFSSLRAAGGILNAMSFLNKISVHSVSADRWIASFLASQEKLDLPFFLNSFSQKVFLCRGQEVRTLLELPEAQSQLENQKVCISFLPEVKQAGFIAADIKLDGLEDSLLQVLEKTEGREHFSPEYAFAAV